MSNGWLLIVPPSTQADGIGDCDGGQSGACGSSAM